MKHRILVPIGIAAVLFLAFTTAIQAQGVKGKGRITGVVVDDAGNPVPKAKILIEFTGGDGTTYETTANKKGEWGFLGLGTGVWRFTATAEGYVGTYVEEYIRQLDKNPRLTITLQREKSGGGIIEDEDAFLDLEEGNDLFEAEDYEGALEAYTRFMEKNPEAYQARLNIGRAYRELGDFVKALAEFTAVLDKAPQDTPNGKEMASHALAEIGICHLKQDDLEKAQEYFKQSVDTYPDNEVIAYNVGEIFFSNGKLDESIEYLNKAAQIKPDWPDPHYKLGLVYLNMGDYAKAKESLNKFLTLEPDSERASSVKAILAQIK